MYKFLLASERQRRCPVEIIKEFPVKCCGMTIIRGDAEKYSSAVARSKDSQLYHPASVTMQTVVLCCVVLSAADSEQKPRLFLGRSILNVMNYPPILSFLLSLLLSRYGALLLPGLPLSFICFLCILIYYEADSMIWPSIFLWCNNVYVQYMVCKGKV